MSLVLAEPVTTPVRAQSLQRPALSLNLSDAEDFPSLALAATLPRRTRNQRPSILQDFSPKVTAVTPPASTDHVPRFSTPRESKTWAERVASDPTEDPWPAPSQEVEAVFCISGPDQRSTSTGESSLGADGNALPTLPGSAACSPLSGQEKNIGADGNPIATSPRSAARSGIRGEEEDHGANRNMISTRYGPTARSPPAMTSLSPSGPANSSNLLKASSISSPGLKLESLSPTKLATSRILGGVANHHASNKKSFNVDSPSFTPALLQAGVKKHTFSSQTANAAVFTPKAVASSSTPTLAQDAESPFLNPAAARDFTPQPQNYDLNTTTNGITADSSGTAYDPFTVSSMNQALPAAQQYNPYADDHTPLAGASSSYYPAQGAYTAAIQPLQYHLYAPVGPNKQDMLHAYQRQAHDFFLPNDIREDLQKKSAATRQIMPTKVLPDVSHYHSLVPLDTAKSGRSFFNNYICWVFKATSQNGNAYCLRRVQGARVNSKESTVGPLQKWRRISNGNVVSPIAVFTARDFGDNSLLFVYDYHPNSKTLAEHHFSANQNPRYQRPQISENVLWSYVCQMCNALKAIHNENLAARCIHLTKVILTEKNRVRLAACVMLDVLEYESSPPLSDLQQDDFVDLGKLILSLGLATPNISNLQVAAEQFGRNNIYSHELRHLVSWLVAPPQSPDQASPKTVDELARIVTGHMFDSFDASLHAADDMTSNLHRELENGRMARLVMKLGVINERPEYDNDPAWSENGERYQLKLFRDYVFHQVDSNGNPLVDLGHIMTCLNKLDAGIDERVYLTSRDHQTCFVVTYKELKKQVANAFNELTKTNTKPTGPRY
ncbi:hypothetical protein BJ170DRAFT_594081 [Xylariales sp. AK1849]|nr:hypothetical protein BJ170DRAFT_594081 [Xylariales sp. AK1849]